MSDCFFLFPFFWQSLELDQNAGKNKLSYVKREAGSALCALDVQRLHAGRYLQLSALRWFLLFSPASRVLLLCRETFGFLLLEAKGAI